MTNKIVKRHPKRPIPRRGALKIPFSEVEKNMKSRKSIVDTVSKISTLSWGVFFLWSWLQPTLLSYQTSLLSIPCCILFHGDCGWESSDAAHFDHFSPRRALELNMHAQSEGFSEHILHIDCCINYPHSYSGCFCRISRMDYFLNSTPAHTTSGLFSMISFIIAKIWGSSWFV